MSTSWSPRTCDYVLMWLREISLWIELMLLIRWLWDKGINEDHLVECKVVIGVLRNERGWGVSVRRQEVTRNWKRERNSLLQRLRKENNPGDTWILAYWDPFQTPDSRTVKITNVCHLKSWFSHYLWLAANAIVNWFQGVHHQPSWTAGAVNERVQLEHRLDLGDRCELSLKK